jgi:hypothetical protein
MRSQKSKKRSSICEKKSERKSAFVLRESFSERPRIGAKGLAEKVRVRSKGMARVGPRVFPNLAPIAGRGSPKLAPRAGHESHKLAPRAGHEFQGRFNGGGHVAPDRSRALACADPPGSHELARHAGRLAQIGAVLVLIDATPPRQVPPRWPGVHARTAALAPIGSAGSSDGYISDMRPHAGRWRRMVGERMNTERLDRRRARRIRERRKAVWRWRGEDGEADGVAWCAWSRGARGAGELRLARGAEVSW